MNFKRVASRLMVALILILTTCGLQQTEARVSKKFLKGFLLGAYMAKHHH